MDNKISILENVSTEIINLFYKKKEKQNKCNFFSFYFDEDENTKETNVYINYDDISDNIFNILNQNLLYNYEFNMEIIKKYVIMIKIILREDIDILNLILKSISLNKDILYYKFRNISVFENPEEFEKFILENIQYNLNDYNNLLSKFYNIDQYIKDKIYNIYGLIYNYSIYYSINILKKNVYIKNDLLL